MHFSNSVWNLVSTINMNAYYLRRSEIKYELRIRGVAIEGNADDLRKKLSHCFSNNIPVDGKRIAQLDPSEELDTCEETFTDLDNLVTDYEGDAKDNEYKCIQARLWHWLLRVERIPIPATFETDLEDRKSDLLGKMKRLVDASTDLKDSREQLQGNEEELEPKTGKPGKPIVSEPQNLSLIHI